MRAPRVHLFSIALIVALALAVVPAGYAQEGPELHPSRSTMTLDVAMTAEPYEGSAPTEAPTVLLLGDGSGGTYDPGCANEQIPALTPLVTWATVGNPFGGEHPVTIFGAFDITLPIVSSGTGPVPPATTGAVELELAVTSNGHPYGAATWTYDPTADGGPTMPAQAEFPIVLDHAHGTVNPEWTLEVTLSASCASAGTWAVEHGSVPTINYVLGDPADADTDADGLPDALDDDADGDGFTEAEENAVGTSDVDAGSNPAMDADGDGFTLEEEVEAGTSDDDADDFPGAGGFPLLLVILVVLGLLLVGGLVFGAMTVLRKNLEVEVSDDGFKAIEKGATAAYDVDVYATGKKEGTLDVELTLKGVPDDWHATIEPHHLQLVQGTEEPEVQTAILTITPPADQEYEDEAVVTVTATPVDGEGKSSALKPGASAKTKTIVNIGVTPPEGEGRKKKKAKKDDEAEPTEVAAEEAGTAEADDEDKPKKRFGGGLLKRKKKDMDDEAGEEEAAEEKTAEEDEAPAAQAEADQTEAAASPAAAAGKPSIAMGKMVHDPADFSAGDEVTTTVNVRNKGDGPVEGLRLSLFVNDERADQQVVDLEAGASEEVTFHWTARPDENRVRIKGGLKGA